VLIRYRAFAAGQPVQIVAEYTPDEHGEPADARIVGASFEGHDIWRSLVIGCRSEAERLQAEAVERCQEQLEEMAGEAAGIAVDRYREGRTYVDSGR
jgi:hypothetical protein